MAVVVASYNYKCDREFGLRTAVVRWCVCVSALVLSFKPQPHVPGAALVGASWCLFVFVVLVVLGLGAWCCTFTLTIGIVVYWPVLLHALQFGLWFIYTRAWSCTLLIYTLHLHPGHWPEQPEAQLLITHIFKVSCW